MPRTRVGRTRAFLCKPLKINHSKFLTPDPPTSPPSADTSRRFAHTSHRHYRRIRYIGLLRATPSSFIPLHERAVRRCFAKFPGTLVAALELFDISPARRTLLILRTIAVLPLEFRAMPLDLMNNSGRRLGFSSTHIPRS